MWVILFKSWPALSLSVPLVYRWVAIHQRQAEPMGAKNARRSHDRPAVPNTISVNLCHGPFHSPQLVPRFWFGVAPESVCGSPPTHPVEPHMPFV